MMRRFQKFAFLTILLMTPFAAWSASCTASGATLAFGTYTGTQIAVTAIITTSCPSGTNYQVGLNAGTGSGATTTTRDMTATSTELGYQMFQNSTHATNWGNTSGTDTVTVTGTGTKTTTVYGLLPAAEAPTPATYKDTITIYVYSSSLGTFTGTMQVSATVSAYCGISASALNFGTYAGALLKVNSSVTATCTSTTPYNVGLNQGTATGATVTNRSMTGPSSTLLAYSLFSNSGLTTNWGNTVGTNTLAGTGNGAAQALTVYGQIAAGLYKNPGSYSDTITATITY
jgi:spore coat protein U-like protein